MTEFGKMRLIANCVKSEFCLEKPSLSIKYDSSSYFAFTLRTVVFVVAITTFFNVRRERVPSSLLGGA